MKRDWRALYERVRHAVDEAQRLRDEAGAAARATRPGKARTRLVAVEAAADADLARARRLAGQILLAGEADRRLSGIRQDVTGAADAAELEAR